MSDFSDLMTSLEPVGWWRLGETSGSTAADSSGRGHHGVYVNSPLLGEDGAIAGDTNKSIKVRRENEEYVEIPDSVDFSLSKANDGFKRHVALGSSWGDAEYEGTWTAQVSTGAYYECEADGVAKIDPNGASGTWQQGLSVSRKYCELQVRTCWSERAFGGPLRPVSLVARRQDADNYYRAQLVEQNDHSLDLQLVKVIGGSAIVLATATNIGTYASAGDWWFLRFRLDGATLSARAWQAQTPQPTAWLVTATDTSIDSAGTVAIRSQNSSSSARPVVCFKDFWVQSLSMSVHFLLKVDELNWTEPEYLYVLGKGQFGQQEWAIRFYPAPQACKDAKEKNIKEVRCNRVSAYIWNLCGDLGAGSYYQPDGFLETDRWYQFVAVFDSGDSSDTQARVRLYLDGLRAGPDSPGQLYHNDTKWDIGPRNGSAPLRIVCRTPVDNKNFHWMD